MSFLNAVTVDQSRAAELRHAWNSLSYDIISQKHSLTPPLTPESYRTQLSPASSYSSSKEFNDERSTHGEPTSVISGVNKTKSSDFYSKTDFPQNLSVSNMFPTSVPCSCCPPTAPPLLLPGGVNIVANKHAAHHPTLPYNISESTTYQSDKFSSSDFRIENLTNKGSTMLKRKLEDEIEASQKKKQKKDEETACQVHGILSLPGCREPRYDITVNELERRVNQPECLTKVDMISYVRLAKNSARSLLDKHSIKTNQHNQRSEHTVLSKMCESEAQVLAKGIREINYRYFPGSWFARKSVQEISKNNPSLRQQHEALLERLKEDEITKCVLLDIYFGMEKRKEDEEMNVFNLISHSFGIPNLQNHILFLLSYIEEELRILKSM